MFMADDTHERGVDNKDTFEDDLPRYTPHAHPTDERNLKTTNVPWFTFDDVPVHKRREKLYQMSAWLDNQLNREGADLREVLTELSARFIGTIRDWFI